MPSYFDLLITRQVQLERLKSGASVVYLRELKKFESLLRLRFSELDEDAQELSRTKLEALISQVQKDQAAVIAAANKTQAKTDADTAQLYQVQEKLDLRATTNVPLAGLATLRKGELIENILKTPLSVNGQLLEPIVKNFTATEIQRVSGAIRKGATEGQTNTQIVRSIIGTKKNNYRDGVLQTTRRNAAAVVNTSMQHAASGARHQFFEKNSETVKRYEWVSTLDSRTSTQCFLGTARTSPIGALKGIYRREYSGKMYTITLACGDNFTVTPNHPILTARGWCRAEELNPCDKIANGFLPDVVTIGDNVDMRPTLSEVFDTVNKPTISEVLTICASPGDLHGDVQVGQEKVEYLSIKSELRDNIYSSVCESVKNDLFVGVHRDVLLSRLRGLSKLVFTGSVTNVATKVDTRTLGDTVETGLADAEFFLNKERSFTGAEKLNSFLAMDVLSTAFSGSPQTELCEKTGGCGGGGIKSPCDLSSTDATVKEFNDVVSVGIEFVERVHVYNLCTSQEVYTVGRSIVKNCRSLDGRIFEIGKGPTPPAHHGCRSTTAPVIEEPWGFLTEGQTRASATGQVDGDETYYSWLKKQPIETQNMAIGPQRGKLLRDGGLSSEKFGELQLNKSFEPLTLDEMRKLEPEAFKEAGI